MNVSFDDGTRMLETPPWEPMGKSLYGHGGFSDARSLQAALVTQLTRAGMGSSRAIVESKSGLTRRGVIYEYIRAHPGSHVRGMARDLGIATGDMQYHLLWLERHGLVKTKRSGFYRFVFPTMAFNETQEVLLGVLSQETPREILLCLLRDTVMTQGDLAKCLGHSQPTISWHMDRLIQLGVVSRSRTSRGLLYELAADREDVLSFVKRYHPEAWRRWSGRLSSIVVGTRLLVNEGPTQRARLAPAAVVELIGKR